MVTDQLQCLHRPPGTVTHWLKTPMLGQLALQSSVATRDKFDFLQVKYFTENQDSTAQSTEIYNLCKVLTLDFDLWSSNFWMKKWSCTYTTARHPSGKLSLSSTVTVKMFSLLWFWSAETIDKLPERATWQKSWWKPTVWSFYQQGGFSVWHISNPCVFSHFIRIIPHNSLSIHWKDLKRSRRLILAATLVWWSCDTWRENLNIQEDLTKAYILRALPISLTQTIQFMFLP